MRCVRPQLPPRPQVFAHVPDRARVVRRRPFARLAAELADVHWRNHARNRTATEHRAPGAGACLHARRGSSGVTGEISTVVSASVGLFGCRAQAADDPADGGGGLVTAVHADEAGGE